MGKTINIAMKCNEEQFNAIEPKLKKAGIELSVWDLGDEHCYLTNNWNEYFCIGNHAQRHDCFKRCDTYEQWNEKVFLEACGIFEEPKFEITKEQILKLHDMSELMKLPLLKKEIKEMFPEAFESEFKSGYYKHKNNKYPNWICYTDFETGKYYGIGACGDWFSGNEEYHRKYIINNCELVTTEEVTEALKNEAVKIGFKLGAYIVRDFDDNLKDVAIADDSYPCNDTWFYQPEDDYLEHYGFVVYSKGQWATVIPTKTIQEAEELLKELGYNFKIV